MISIMLDRNVILEHKQFFLTLIIPVKSYFKVNMLLLTPIYPTP